jgi:DNA-binding PadR family transcriptional regulator
MKELTKIEEILLLAIWRLKKNAYGVKIRQHVSSVMNKDFTYGNLYSALNQLERKEYVTKTTGELTPNRRGRPRVIYTINPLGFEALKASYELNEAMWGSIPKYAIEHGLK